DVAVAGDAILAVGSIGDEPRLWRSLDRGETWEVSNDRALETVSYLSHVAADGPTALVSGMPAGAEGTDPAASTVLLRSTDAGETWAPAAHAPPTEDTESELPLDG